MGLYLRSSSIAEADNTITIQGTSLAYNQADNNFMYLLTNMSGSNVKISGSTGILGNVTINGSLTITSNLFATSSWATKALTSSFSTNITGSADRMARYNGSNNLTSSLLEDNGIYVSMSANYAGSSFYIKNISSNLSTVAIKGEVSNKGKGIYGIGNNSGCVGVYAEGSSEGTALVANSLSDTSNIAEFKSGSTSTITISPEGILTLIPQHPLPTLQPTGSIAMSGSGVNLKLYFYNGTSWAAV